MDFSLRTRALYSFVKDIEKGKYNFHHKLQRREGQWPRLQKSELIDSLLRAYPIDPIRCEVKDGINYVFDGTQRATNLYDFLKDKYPLSKTLKPVIIEDTEYEIAGKKFSKLDEAVQDKIKAYEIQVYLFLDCTENDIREMFRRQNNGKPLNAIQKFTSIMSDELSDVVYSLASHSFVVRMLGETQIKRAMDNSVIFEVLMLTELSSEYDFGSFKKNDKERFILKYNNEINTEKVEIVRKALDKLEESINEEIKIPKTSLSLVIYGMYKVIKDKKSTDDYIRIVKEFVDNYESNTEYLAFCQSGTANGEMVKGRLEYFRKLIREMKKDFAEKSNEVA